MHMVFMGNLVPAGTMLVMIPVVNPSTASYTEKSTPRYPFTYVPL